MPSRWARLLNINVAFLISVGAVLASENVPAELIIRMNDSSLIKELRQAAQKIVDDRDNLSNENNYLKSIITAQQVQLQRYEEILRITQGDLPIDPERQKKDSDGYWVKTFLYNPKVDSNLASAVKAWCEKDVSNVSYCLLSL